MGIVRGKLLALVMLASVLASCGDSKNDAEDGVIVEGVVRNAVTGKGIKGAHVKLVSDVLDEAETTTGSHGGYDLLVHTQTPRAHLTAEKSGYEPRTVSVYLDDGDVQIDVDLTPKP